MNFQVTTKHMKRCSAHNRHSTTVGLCEFKKKMFNIISHQGNENQNHSGTRGFYQQGGGSLEGYGQRWGEV